MSKRKTFGIFLSADDRIDVDLEFTGRAGAAPRIRRFAITYSARIRDRWWEVVRYDNFHGYLHRQRFWRSAKPERLPAREHLPIDALVERCRQDLRQNGRRYRMLREANLPEE